MPTFQDNGHSPTQDFIPADVYQSTVKRSLSSTQRDRSPSQKVKIEPPDNTSICNVHVRVVLVGGDPRRRFPGISDLVSTISLVNTEAKVMISLADSPQIAEPLRHIYGLTVLADHDGAYFSFTDRDRNRHSIDLCSLKDETGAIGEWKRQIVRGQLSAAAPCDCTNFGEACHGAPHMPEIHEVLSLDHLIQQAHDYFEADTLNEETIIQLESEVTQMDQELQKCEMERTKLKTEHAACKDEINNLKSQNTGLWLSNKDLEEQVSGVAKRRTLRSRRKT